MTSYPYPFLDNNGEREDYIENIKYELEFVRLDNNEMIFKHILKGESFIKMLFDEGKINFCITTTVKEMMFRKTHKIKAESMEQMQKIDISAINNHKNKIYYLGQIVYIGDKTSYIIDSNKYGIDEIFDKEEIVLENGNILGEYWLGPDKTFGSMITITRDEILKYGFKINIMDDRDGYFSINMASKLYDQFNKNQKSVTGNNLTTHIMTACLYELQKYYNNNFDDMPNNFKMIEDVLIDKGIISFKNEDFNPNEAASAINPIKFEMEEENE